jgi:hypothetical protein
MKEYFERFFAEKNLPYTAWEIQASNGDLHFIDSDVVIEAIKNAPHHEQEQIKKMLVRIDFVNGDVLDYLQHLARGLIETSLKNQEDK